MNLTRHSECGKWLTAGLVMVIVLVTVSQVLAEVRYTVTDLGGVFNQAVGQARAINNAGQVAGWSGDYAFLYSGGTMTALNTSPNYSIHSHGWGINSAGQVAGDYVTGGNFHACIYSDGTRTDLGTIGDGTQSYARAINDSGHVAGYSQTNGSGPEHAFLYRDGTMTDLGTLSGRLYSFAYAVNNADQVVGRCESRAFLYSGGLMTDLGAAYFSPSDESCAYGINDSGQIVGYANFGYASHRAFLISGGTATQLGTLDCPDSEAYGINSAGLVVGMSGERAFLYADGLMTDLNDLIDPAAGWDLHCATAINDNGQIVGYGINPQGYRYPFLLTVIPEPATMSLLALGLAAMVTCRRRGRR